jgi:hypothetical protein
LPDGIERRVLVRISIDRNATNSEGNLAARMPRNLERGSSTALPFNVSYRLGKLSERIVLLERSLTAVVQTVATIAMVNRCGPCMNRVK